jgi:hypothetical protein
MVYRDVTWCRQSTVNHIPTDHNLNNHQYENIKFVARFRLCSVNYLYHLQFKAINLSSATTNVGGIYIYISYNVSAIFISIYWLIESLSFYKNISSKKVIKMALIMHFEWQVQDSR